MTDLLSEVHFDIQGLQLVDRDERLHPLHLETLFIDICHATFRIGAANMILSVLSWSF